MPRFPLDTPGRRNMCNRRQSLRLHSLSPSLRPSLDLSLWRYWSSWPPSGRAPPPSLSRRRRAGRTMIGDGEIRGGGVGVPRIQANSVTDTETSRACTGFASDSSWVLTPDQGLRITMNLNQEPCTNAIRSHAPPLLWVPGPRRLTYSHPV